MSVQTLRTGQREQSQTLHKGWGREIYGPCQITVLFPRSAFSLPPPTYPTFVSKATDPSIPYLTTVEDHLLSFLPCNLVAFCNSIPRTHVCPQAGLSSTSRRECVWNGPFVEDGCYFLSSSWPLMGTAQMCGAKMATVP